MTRYDSEAYEVRSCDLALHFYRQARMNGAAPSGFPFRFSFAGRACAACIPEMRRVHERPGWSA